MLCPENSRAKHVDSEIVNHIDVIPKIGIVTVVKNEEKMRKPPQGADGRVVRQSMVFWDFLHKNLKRTKHFFYTVHQNKIPLFAREIGIGTYPQLGIGSYSQLGCGSHASPSPSVVHILN